MMLKEFVESRSSGDGLGMCLSLILDPVAMSLSALEIRNITRGMKKKKSGVDTKGSKGRKIRYAPHEKLVSFMVGIEDSSEKSWPESMQRQLFAGLFLDGDVVEGKVGGGVQGDALKIFA
jgi:hypothetical protein